MKHSAKDKSTDDLQGNVPDQCVVALLLVDVISDFDFDGADKLLPRALKAAERIASLKARAVRANVPCVYVNDNYGRWRSDFQSQVRRCRRSASRGRAISELLVPTRDDYFVLKPRHSAFFQTCLSVLLEHLGVRTLVITGFSTDSCITFTAMDAYLRNYSLIVPSDGTAAAEARSHRAALTHMRRTLKARIPRCAQVRLHGCPS